MNLQSSIIHISIKLILLMAFVLLVAYFDYAIIMRQTYLVYIWLAVLLLAMLFIKKTSQAYSYATKLSLLSVYIIFSIYFGILLLTSTNFNILMVFIFLCLPVLFIQLKFTTYIYLTLIFFFSWVGVGHSGIENIYSRGAGTLPFHLSFPSIFLYLIAIIIVIKEILEGGKFTSKANFIPCNLYKYFLAFNIVFGLYCIWGIFTGVPPSLILNRRGTINVTNMTILVFVMLYVFRTEKDFKLLKNFFITFVAFKSIWGFYRFLFLRGDPVNMYAWATLGGRPYGIDVITFWDIGDSLILGVCAFYALWAFFFYGEGVSKSKKFFYLTVAIICLLNIVFSYRRAAWGGLVFLVTWLFLCLPVKKRLTIGVLILICCAILLAGVVSKRGDEEKGFGVFHDVQSKGTGEVTVKEGRFFELYIAWQTIKKSPIFGTGPWGKYKQRVGLSEEEYYLPASDLVHSAIVHMGLKMGLIGVFFYISFFYKYVQFWLTRRNELPLEIRGFAEASFAGVLFLVPETIFATSIIEYRTMVLTGFFLAIPYLNYYLYKKREN